MNHDNIVSREEAIRSAGSSATEAHTTEGLPSFAQAGVLDKTHLAAAEQLTQVKAVQRLNSSSMGASRVFAQQILGGVSPVSLSPLVPWRKGQEPNAGINPTRVDHVLSHARMTLPYATAEHFPVPSISSVSFSGAGSGFVHLQAFPGSPGSDSVRNPEMAVPTLPSMSQASTSYQTMAPGGDLTVLADRIYDLLLKRLASERQRRGM
jgi:hypothetical protein